MNRRITVFFVVLTVLLAFAAGYLIVRSTQRDTSKNTNVNDVTEGTDVTDIAFYKTKQECEQQSGKKCNGPLQCDYVPEGKTFEEVCGKGFFKGAYKPLSQ